MQNCNDANITAHSGRGMEWITTRRCDMCLMRLLSSQVQRDCTCLYMYYSKIAGTFARKIPAIFWLIMITQVWLEILYLRIWKKWNVRRYIFSFCTCRILRDTKLACSRHYLGTRIWDSVWDAESAASARELLAWGYEIRRASNFGKGIMWAWGKEIPYSAVVSANVVNVCKCVQVEGITEKRRHGIRKMGVQTEKYPGLTTGGRD